MNVSKVDVEVLREAVREGRYERDRVSTKRAAQEWSNEAEAAIEAVVELITDAERMAKWISHQTNFLPDHACAECVGVDGELVKKGFRCGYHTAMSYIGGAS